MSQLLPLSTVSEVASLRLQVTSNSKGQTQIDLSNRKLGPIPVEIFHFTHIQVLKLSNNEINHLPSAVSHLRNLKVLHLDKNRLTQVPETLVNCKNLTELNLSANCIQVLPTSICYFRKLRILEVAYNQLEHLPHDIGKLRQLRHLVAHHNKLWFLPFSITNLINLWSLQLAGNLFDHVPMSVCQLTSLHTLNMSCNRLASLPPDFDTLRNLRELNLSDNRLTSIELSMLRLQQIKYLNLSGNRLEILPTEMGRMKQLKVLHVHKNNIHTVADVFPNVQFLNLAKNNLTSLIVWQMYRLENLNLSSNQLEVLPQGLSRLRNLKCLQLDHNNLHEVTPDISKLRKLETLDLSFNKLTYLPLPVYQMNSLRSFNIHGNNIPALPPGSIEPLHRGGGETVLGKGGAYGEGINQEASKVLPTSESVNFDKSSVKYADNFIIKPKADVQGEITLPKSPGSKSFSLFRKKTAKVKSEVSTTRDVHSHHSLRSYAIMKKKSGSKRKKNTTASWDLNKTMTSQASFEMMPGLDDVKSQGTTRPHSEFNSTIRLMEPMSVLSTAEFQIDEIQADFSSEEDFEDSDSTQSDSKPSMQAITQRLIKADIPAYKPTIGISGTTGEWCPADHKEMTFQQDDRRLTTDYNLLGLCTELETMMNKKLLHPALILNTGLSKCFNEKVLKKSGDGLWRMSGDGNDGDGDDDVYGIEYSPLETFTITENGGHYVSNYDVNIQIDVPSRAIHTTVHSTIQVLKINGKVLSQVQKLNRFADNVLEIGPIVMLRLLENVNFDSQVKITIPAPKTVKGHTMLLTIQGDNSCIPSSSGFQYNRGLVTFNTWHFTKRVAIVTKAKCKYKACKSMEQILQCLGLVDSVNR